MSRDSPPLAPFPAPDGKPSNAGVDVMSPDGSVFSHQDSASSDEYNSAPELTPSPDRSLVKVSHKTTPPHQGEATPNNFLFYDVM